MKRMMIVFAWICVSAICGAGEPVKVDSLEVDGQTYKAASVSRLDHLNARIRHETGFKTVRIADLPEPIRDKIAVKPKAPSFPVVVHLKGMEPSGSLFQNYHKLASEQRRPQGTADQSVSVVQSISTGKILVMFEGMELGIIYGDTRIYADGDKVTLPIRASGRTEDYITVLGAKKRVRTFLYSPPFTTEDFISALKNGAEFVVETGTEDVACPKCGGEPVACEECDSTGTAASITKALLKW